MTDRKAIEYACAIERPAPRSTPRWWPVALAAGALIVAAIASGVIA